MLFTAENAVMMQAKGVIVRKHNDQVRKTDLEQAVKSALFTAPATDDSYLNLRLIRTREDIESVREQMLAKIKDGQAVNWYASALDKLSEIERLLAGRPMPGSLKPTRERTKPSQPLGQLQGEPIPEDTTIGGVPNPDSSTPT